MICNPDRRAVWDACRIVIAFGGLLAGGAASAAAQTAGGEWRSHGGDAANTRYAPLDRITAGNFDELEVAWRVKTENFGPVREYKFQSTPLMAGGVVYSTAGVRRAAIAVDAATGELLWMHRIDDGERLALTPRHRSRGLAWRDDGGDGQIFYVTPGYRLVGLNARTGERLAGFGEDGIVDLMRNMDQDIDPLLARKIGLNAAPLVAGDTIIVGGGDVRRPNPGLRFAVKGHVRGYDAATGARKWIFHTIPGADEFGNDTWLNDSWRYTGNTGVWGQISADLELGIVYLPTEAPTNDHYGGHRHGDNLFSDSIVAVDVETGQRLWHLQAIHHDVWDWDFPCAPILADVVIDGVERRILAQPSKQAWLYVLDRVTGEPIWPIEERATPPSDVPGELLSPTQPFPTRPPAYDRQGVGIDDLIDFTPELRAEAVELVSNFRLGPIFTPPVVADPDGPWGTLMLPSTGGATSWPGGSLDPETGIFYGYSGTEVDSPGLVHDPERSDMDYIRGNPPGVPAPRRALNVRGLPLVKPPWGRITAIDLGAGEILWQVAHGETPDHVRNHPDLAGLDVPRTGRAGRVGTLVTRTLLIAAEPGTFTTPSGAVGAMLRAYDKTTGAEVGAVYMPAPASGSPMTYLHEGRQYLVMAIGGAGFPSELIAWRLPD